MKAAGFVEFARMPPTRAAASRTTSIASFAKKARTACWSVKSRVSRVRVTRLRYPCAANSRTSAEPTMPRGPATKIRDCRSIVAHSLEVLERLEAGQRHERIAPCDLVVGQRHLAHKRFERRARLPAELLARLRTI